MELLLIFFNIHLYRFNIRIVANQCLYRYKRGPESHADIAVEAHNIWVFPPLATEQLDMPRYRLLCNLCGSRFLSTVMSIKAARNLQLPRLSCEDSPLGTFCSGSCVLFLRQWPSPHHYSVLFCFLHSLPFLPVTM